MTRRSLHEDAVHLRHPRREWLRIGALGTLSLTLPSLLRGRAQGETVGSDAPTFGRAKNIIYLFLSGGPSQYETFDPKPEAPSDIRGSFQPIATNVPGIQFCELLPRTARIADRLAVVRSMATDDPNHDSGGYWVNTGYKYTGPNMRSVTPTDWPTLGSVIKLLKPSDTIPFSSVVLPEPILANPNVFLPGQNGGFLWNRWDPEFFHCDPSAPNFEIASLTLSSDVSPSRLSARKDLLEKLNRQSQSIPEVPAVREYGQYVRESFDVLLSGAARTAFSLDRESQELRDRYGRGKWGQSVLLARRLVEAGVRMVFVNWPREPGDLSASNPLWDTHAQNDARMKDVLCPQFDLGFTALIEDLEDRGLLDETLVVAIGEMGRTPRFNSAGGRDHWGQVWSFVMAGAGIRTAQVVGASDKQGMYPVADRVEPGDMTATMLHLLGIGHDAFFPDRFGRPHPVTDGNPIAKILGNDPATMERTTPGGVVPPVSHRSEALLVDLDFEPPADLAPAARPLRGWSAAPLLESGRPDDFAVVLARVPGERSRSGEHHVAIGYGLHSGNGTGSISQGTRAILCQEIHNPRPGRFTFSVHASGGAYDRPDYYRDVWLANFTCRLAIFGFADSEQDFTRIIEFASQTFEPPFAGPNEADYRRYSVSTTLESQNGGANQLNHGIGVAVIVEKVTPGILDVDAGGPFSQGLIRIDDVELEFDA